MFSSDPIWKVRRHNWYEPHPVHVGIGECQTTISHEEVKLNVIMAYHMIQEAAAPIREWYLMIWMCIAFK